MENRIISEKIRKSPQVFRNVIKEENLSLYEQAAEKTGYGMSVTAREGDLITNRAERTSYTVKVEPGFVQVSVTVPLGQEKVGTTPFYEAVRELEQPPK